MNSSIDLGIGLSGGVLGQFVDTVFIFWIGSLFLIVAIALVVIMKERNGRPHRKARYLIKTRL